MCEIQQLQFDHSSLTQIEDDYRRTSWRPNRFPQHRHGDSAPNATPSIPSNTLNAYLALLVSGLLLGMSSMSFNL